MMSNQGVDPMMLNAWLSARSIARGLPPPIPEYGGFRVDTMSEAEVARWVFPKVGSGLEELARSINEPRYFLKLCGSAEELRGALPTGWTLHDPRFFMQASGKLPVRHLPDGYTIEIECISKGFAARIFSKAGELAASGYAAEAQGVFIYDRISTEPEHHRQGLGHFLIQALHGARQNPKSAELLVATEDGRALYSALGWKTMSHYSTASIATT